LVSTTFGISLYHLTPIEAIYGATIGYCSLWLIATIGKAIKGIEVMGAGDFKLLAGLGTFVGIQGVVFTIFSSSFIGILTWLILKAIGKNETMIPYGPSLIIGSIIYLFYGKTILSFLGIVF
jgi:leader peptidase (prepilin peptidase)/N-methyltransferase